MNTVINFIEEGVRLVVHYKHNKRHDDDDSYLMVLVELNMMYTNAQIELARDNASKYEYNELHEIYEDYMNELERVYCLS